MLSLATPPRASPRSRVYARVGSKARARYPRRVDREQKIAAIMREARKTRPRTSRAMWIGALSVGTLGLIAFAVIMFTDGGSWSSRASSGGSRPCFTSGMLIGVLVGIASGFAIARHRTKSDSHSSRNKP